MLLQLWLGTQHDITVAMLGYPWANTQLSDNVTQV